MIAHHIRTRYVAILEVGIYIGIVTLVPGDTDPERTRRRQLQRIYTMIRRGRLPYIKLGKRVMFDLDEIDQWMRTGAHRTCLTSQP